MGYLDSLGDLIRGSGSPSNSILVVSYTIASSDLLNYSGTCFLIDLYLVVRLLAYPLTWLV
jgi:hypothetical protein